MLYFIFWKLGFLSTNYAVPLSCYSTIAQIAIHFCGTRMNGLSRAMIFFHDAFLKSIHHWYIKYTLIPQYIISPLLKSQYCFLMNILFNSRKWSFFYFTFDTNDDLYQFVTTISPYVESTSMTLKHASLCTSLANSMGCVSHIQPA